MPCYSPLQAYRTDSGDIVFSELSRHRIHSGIQLPCGQCIGCRLERSRQWAVRCVHEAQMHTHNCFITLTYDDEQLPEHGSLRYRDFVLFMKRLRKHTGAPGLRFYMCGEYGSNYGRPHYHACIFGHDFEDRYYWRTTSSGAKSYRSPTLEKLWTHGNSEIGTVTFESAAYIARYCVQKITGPMAKWAYGPCTPEFNQMSRGKGIGKTWLEKYLPDVYPHDYVIARGAKSKPPKYYDKHLAKIDPILLGQIKESREIDGTSRRGDNTPERMKAKEAVAKAKSKLLKRSES